MRGAKGKEGRDETEMVPAHLNMAGLVHVRQRVRLCIHVYEPVSRDSMQIIINKDLFC